MDFNTKLDPLIEELRIRMENTVGLDKSEISPHLGRIYRGGVGRI